MKVNLDKLTELMLKFHANPPDMPKLCDITQMGWSNINRYGYADPEVVGRLAAFLGCDPRTITIRSNRKRHVHPYAADINGYRIECIMAREDISYEELRMKVGFDPAGYIKVGYCRQDKAEAIAKALYTDLDGILFKSLYKNEADPAGTEPTSNENMTQTV